MSEPGGFDAFFGADYFEIYRDVLTEERTAAEVEGIVARLGLAPGARVLDLACGHGRHAIPLAARGCTVTGYDRSEVFLARAQRDAAARGVSVRWVRGDMRELPFVSAFDAVLNIFTAFGYFASEAEDVETLSRVRRALAPGGSFLVETLHRDALLARFRPHLEWDTSGGARVVRDYRFDLAADAIHDHIQLTRPDGSRVEFAVALRLRSLRDWLALLRSAGLEPVAWCGGLDGSPLELTSHRLVIVSRAAA